MKSLQSDPLEVFTKKNPFVGGSQQLNPFAPNAPFF